MKKVISKTSSKTSSEAIYLYEHFEYSQLIVFMCSYARINSSPANDHYYNNFDATNDESIAEVERSIEMPRTIEEVMKDVIVYVEVRSGTENRTSGIKSAIANLGAKVNDRLLR